MFGKGSRMYSIRTFTCPRCQEGQFFVSNPYDIKNAGNILPNCPSCGLKYEKEPGFFYGAMYVSYALGVALFVILWTSFNLFFPNVTIGWQIGTIITTTIMLSPFLYALSKIVWANLFYHYDKEAIEQYRSAD
jgi:uncharacterized protein (DUF983 family)